MYNPPLLRVSNFERIDNFTKDVHNQVPVGASTQAKLQAPGYVEHWFWVRGLRSKPDSLCPLCMLRLHDQYQRTCSLKSWFEWNRLISEWHVSYKCYNSPRLDSPKVTVISGKTTNIRPKWNAGSRFWVFISKILLVNESFTLNFLENLGWPMKVKGGQPTWPGY